MDCFNNFCPFRENTTSNLNRCECVACTNRCHKKYTFVSISETRKQHLMISALVAKERIDIL